MIGSKIAAIEYYLPKNKENNSGFKKNNPKVNIDRIKEKTGINNRYLSGKNETVIDISIKATNKLLKKFPKASINVLFPAPGTPVIPILIVFLFLGLRLARIWLDNSLSE